MRAISGLCTYWVCKVKRFCAIEKDWVKRLNAVQSFGGL